MLCVRVWGGGRGGVLRLMGLIEVFRVCGALGHSARVWQDVTAALPHTLGCYRMHLTYCCCLLLLLPCVYLSHAACWTLCQQQQHILHLQSPTVRPPHINMRPNIPPPPPPPEKNGHTCTHNTHPRSHQSLCCAVCQRACSVAYVLLAQSAI